MEVESESDSESLVINQIISHIRLSDLPTVNYDPRYLILISPTPSEKNSVKKFYIKILTIM